ncbi:uncharacterized protein L201_005592 [Kwoniella dendrophila CBS 6074]|uniref:UBC core domain-containing protein n=1 Tax=Kwoniella dendrophila CBS 6074 TaxID=1295534 RepID=A0AAX4JYU8_9TREE
MFGNNNSRAQTSTATRRLMKEYRDLTADPLQDTITAGPVSEDNMLEWEALIQGPEGTPYPADYPLNPFTMTFDPPLLHPNKPNIESGADIECCKLYRDSRPEFERRVREQVRNLLGI